MGSPTIEILVRRVGTAEAGSELNAMVTKGPPWQNLTMGWTEKLLSAKVRFLFGSPKDATWSMTTRQLEGEGRTILS